MAINIGVGGVKLKNVCEYLATELTQKQIDLYLQFAGIENRGKGRYPNGLDLKKESKLYESLAFNFNKTNSFSGIERFLEVVFDPTKFTQNKNEYYNKLDNINAYLSQIGVEIDKSGKVKYVDNAKTLDEVEMRILNLRTEIINRNYHKEVLRYCTNELLSKDYYHAIFEATKGVFERIRDMSGFASDGTELIKAVFDIKKPYILIKENFLKTQTEKNIYIGNVNLLKYLALGIRNPIAHNPRINVEEELNGCLEILSIISMAHKFLDECYKIPVI